MDTLTEQRSTKALLIGELSSSRQSEPGSKSTPRLLGLVRLGSVAFGLVAIAWGTTVFPIFWRQLTIEHTATAIISHEPFKPGALDVVLPAVEQIEAVNDCNPAASRNAAIIRLRLAEDAVTSGRRDSIKAKLDALELSVRRSLACTPSDSFLWLAMAWLDGVRVGFGPEQARYLRLSYQLGPNEGWIAVSRNRLALSIFSRLPADVADAAVGEFARLVDSGIGHEAIDIFVGPGWPVRDRLLAALQHVSKQQRKAFAAAVYDAGYDVTVPGIAPRDPRPWY